MLGNHHLLLSPQNLRAGMLAVFLVGIAACNDAEETRKSTVSLLDLDLDRGAFTEQLSYGLNVGGSAFVTRAGESLAADDCSSDSGDAACGSLPRVARSQNPGLYQSYRVGEQDYLINVANGEYDVVLYFVEPDPEAGKTRRFNVSLQDELVLEDFNLLEVNSLQSAAAMARTVPRVKVADGRLRLSLRSVNGDPLLCGILVRRSRFSEEGWNLVWSDEFHGKELNAEHWTPQNWPAEKVNEEDQAYTDRLENVRVEEGVLVLEARLSDADAEYTSGRVNSRGKQSFLYGRLDIRARIPEGKGVWPALWLLPEDPYRYATNCDGAVEDWQGNDNCNAWPNSGEIDLMEHVGYEPGVVHGTVHTRDYFFMLGTQVGEAVLVPDLGEAFHVYSLIWEPGRLAMYVDGVRYFAYFENGEGIGQWPFDHPFHVVMNLAVGGAWGSALGPVDKSVFPRRLEVDYLRIFEPFESVGAPGG